MNSGRKEEMPFSIRMDEKILKLTLSWSERIVLAAIVMIIEDGEECIDDVPALAKKIYFDYMELATCLSLLDHKGFITKQDTEKNTLIVLTQSFIEGDI